MANTETKTKIKPNLKISEPSLFKIIYVNDDITTMEFVVESLMSHFDYTSDSAIKVTENIHTSGSAVVAVLPYEIAEQKGIEVTVEARNQGYPLQIKIESEA
jgi:ATP-dependent Clp protease adaptor protein ClpS